MSRRLRAGMVGGGPGAFIGGVHRQALALTGQIELVAGAFSSEASRGQVMGQMLGLSTERTYGSWQDMLRDERERLEHDRLDLVIVVTPNHLHYPVARAFAEAGFHVVCDKPLVHTSAQAADLLQVVQAAGTLFAVTYNYTGYPMVRQARDMIREGQLGDLRKVTVQYNQGWLSTRIEQAGNKQAAWRTDPARSGLAGAVGDIGSHAENLLSTVTGLELESLCADLTTFVPERQLDDDASILLRFRGGARGVIMASQVSAGLENDLTLQVSGSLGTLAWRQEEPNRLHVWRLAEPQQILTRGSPQLSASALAASRLPSGHPEGFLGAFSNLYRGIAEAILARQEKRCADPQIAQFPTLEEGVRGVRFIETAVLNARENAKWTVLIQAQS